MFSSFSPLFVGAVVAIQMVAGSGLGRKPCFSPLFVGAVVAMVDFGTYEATYVLGFSPLFVGAVVAIIAKRWDTVLVRVSVPYSSGQSLQCSPRFCWEAWMRFQSPIRRGSRCNGTKRG